MVRISWHHTFINNHFKISNLQFLCTNLLFTSKMSQQDKTISSSLLKSKHIRPAISPQPGFNIQPTICNILHAVYQNETSWPEIFIKAYFDDSLGERTWVDNPSCKEFVQNTATPLIQNLYHSRLIITIRMRQA